MATLAEKIRWVLTDRERRRSTLEWYGAKALFRRPRLKLPFGETISYFKTYGQYWGCRSQIPDRGCCALLERRIGIGSTVIDVGAYMGVFTVMIGKLAGKAVVYSFEPTSITYGQLVLNIRENHLKWCDRRLMYYLWGPGGRIPAILFNHRGPNDDRTDYQPH